MKTLVIFSFVMIYFQSTLGDWGHPHYSFRCRESTGIEIFGFHKDSTVTISEGKTTQECKPAKLAIGLFSIPYNCTNTIQNGTKITGFEVGIHVVDPEFDMTSSTINPNITGGHNGHNFNIKCFNIPDHGVNRTVAKVFQGGAHELPVNNKEVSSVDMHFRATKDINAPDISEIYIGDAFYMFLEYTGKANYTVKPKQCKAYEGTVVPTTDDGKTRNVTLWNSPAKANNCSEHKQLLDLMELTDDKKAVTAKMYGFRFSNSAYITITCDVGIFPTSKQNSTELCMAARRKREAQRLRREILDTPIQRKNIIGKLRVTDHSSQYSSSANSIQGSFGWFKLFWGIIIMPFFRNVGNRL